MRRLLWLIPIIFMGFGFWFARGSERPSVKKYRALPHPMRAGYRKCVLRWVGSRILFTLAVNSALFILARLYFKPWVTSVGLLVFLLLILTSLTVGAFWFYTRKKRPA